MFRSTLSRSTFLRGTFGEGHDHDWEKKLLVLLKAGLTGVG